MVEEHSGNGQAPQAQTLGRLAYTLKEVAELVPIGRNKLYDEARAGRLKVRRTGRINLVLATELQAYLDSLPLADFVAESAAD